MAFKKLKNFFENLYIYNLDFSVNDAKRTNRRSPKWVSRTT